jgi:hypothetical protein
MGSVRTLIWLCVLSAVAAAAPPKPKTSKLRAAPAYVVLLPVTTALPLSAPGADELRRHVGRWENVTIAAAETTEKDAAAILKRTKAAGLELALSLRAGKQGGLDAGLIVSTYPGHVLRTEYRASADGAALEALIGPLVEQLVNDLAKDLRWAPKP